MINDQRGGRPTIVTTRRFGQRDQTVLRILLSVAALFYAPVAIAARVAPDAAPRAAASSADGEALAAAVRDLCNRDVALLGEADHGDGRTIEFKVALVQQLIGPMLIPATGEARRPKIN